MEPKLYRDWSLELERMQPKRRLDIDDTPQFTAMNPKARTAAALKAHMLHYHPDFRAELADAPQTPLELRLAYVSFAVGAVCVAAAVIFR